jgi:hypothetical protein
MKRPQRSRNRFNKVVSEQFSIPAKRGGGVIKIAAWENQPGEIVKYSLAYINHLIFPQDNGRVLGYDNTHNFHHRHYFGKITEVTDFTSYTELVERFEEEIKEFIK